MVVITGLMAAIGALRGAAGQPPSPAAQQQKPPTQQQKAAAEYVQRLDANHDGLLQPSEIPPASRQYVAKFAQRENLDPSQPIPIARLLAAIQANLQSRNAERDTGDGKQTGAADDDATEVPGFGVEEDEMPEVPGFGEPVVSLEERYGRRVIEYVDGILRRYDANRNGQLDADEWKAIPWRSDPKESDLNKDGVLTKAEFCERISKRWGQSSPQRNDSRDSRSGGSSSSKKSDEDSEKIRNYARSLLKQYDENKNGVLEKDEWGKMKSSYHSSDVNEDGAITLDELTAKLGAYAKERPSNDSSSSSRKSTSDSPPSSHGSRSGHPRSTRSSSGSSGKGERKTYRFLSPTERLPEGLPDWFNRNDADADGQITMREYSATWSDEKAAEFARHDLNGDGIVTPRECLAALQAMEDDDE